MDTGVPILCARLSAPMPADRLARRLGWAQRLAAVVLLVTVSLWARADGQHHILWAVKGDQNTVYLLGSVHVLKFADSDLPSEALHAYAAAKVLVMELDLSNFRPDQILNSVVGLGTLPGDQTLEAALGPDLYERFAARARLAGLDPAFMSHFQPWLAAMTLEEMELTSLGFAPGAGVDMQLARRAQADRKKVVGLETIDEQFRIFADMSMDDQRRMVQNFLLHGEPTAKDMEAIVSAWRAGDAKAIERLVGRELDNSPELSRRLISDRNRNWLPQITRLLRDSDDYLVVVGALHLIGTDGIVALLERQGYEVVQR